MPRCGKSHYGQLLAIKSGLPFYDLDQAVEKLYEQQTGEVRSPRQLFIEQGEGSFRQWETKALLHLQTAPAGILALGGGSCEPEAHHRLLPSMGQLIYLVVPMALLLSRFHEPRPPYLQQGIPLQMALEALEEKRRPHFEQLATTTIALEHHSSQEELLEELFQLLPRQQKESPRW